MTVSKALRVMRPAMSVVPSIDKPHRNVGFYEKLFWTGLTMLVFLIASEVPLYGIGEAISSDPFYWLRTIFASNRGTLMELGIGPTVTSGLILQLLAGAGFLSYDQTKKDERALFNGAQKLIGLIFTFIQAVAYVFVTNMYGTVGKGPNQLHPGLAWIVIAQLTLASLMVTLLDEMVQKGWGFGSGISLFIATNVCESIMWKAFSIHSVEIGRGKEYEGAVIALIHLLFTNPNKLGALREAFFRTGLPNLANILATLFVFGVVIYLQGFKAYISIKHTQMKGKREGFPIKLFYTSNMPVMLQNALVSNLFMVSQFLSTRMAGNTLVSLFGKWQESDHIAGQKFPVGGLIYYMSAPQTLTDMVLNPLHTLLYMAFMLASCGLLSRVWIEVSGSAAKDVAASLEAQGMGKPGHRKESLKRELQRYIPTAAGLGGIVVGALTVMADLLGAIGSGTGILLAVTTINQYSEIIAQEYAKAMM